MQTCKNCGESSEGNYCSHCGQKMTEHTNRSVLTLLGDLINNMLLFDNRFWISLKYLIVHPGRMTTEYLSGKRRKFISPVSLYLLANLIYFFFTPLTDYSLPLHDQTQRQPYSGYASELVDQKLESDGMSFTEYEVIYNERTIRISKTLMILNVPLIAFFVYVISFRKRSYYYDSLIFSLHFFTAFLLSICTGFALANILYTGFEFFDFTFEYWRVWINMFVIIIPTIYAILSIKRFLDLKWPLSILGGFWILIAGALTQFLYRFVIFLITLWMT